MEWVSFVLFESFPALFGIFALAAFLALVAWRRGGSIRPLLIVSAVSVALLITQAAVTTHRERAIVLMRPVVRELKLSRSSALEALLADDFQAGRSDRAAFIAMARERLANIGIHWLENTKMRVVSSTADSFMVEATYIASTREYSGPFLSVWALEFSRRNDEWLITKIEPIRLADGEVTWSQLMP